jgi:manganese oxidase
MTSKRNPARSNSSIARPQLVALGGVSFLALAIGMLAPANWINMRLSARDVAQIVKVRAGLSPMLNQS